MVPGAGVAAGLWTAPRSALECVVCAEGVEGVRLSWRTGAALVAVAVGAVGVGAWIGSPDKSVPPVNPLVRPSDSATDWPHLVARVSCDASGRITVAGYVPSTWQVAKTAAFPSPAAVGARMGDGTSVDVTGTIAGTLCPSTGGPPAGGGARIAAELFNPDFTLLAVQLITPGGGHHVGVLDRSGAVTDLTAAAGATSSESDPLFTPDGKALVFSTGSGRSAQAATVGERAVPGGAMVSTVPAGTQVLLSTLAANEVVVPDPSAPAVAVLDQSGAATLSIWHLPASGPVDGHGQVGLLHHVGGASAEPWQLAACTPVAWVTDTTLLCMGVGAGRDLGAPASGDFWTVRLASTGAAADGPRAEETAAAVSPALLPDIAGTFYAAPVLVGSTLYYAQLGAGSAHAWSVPVTGGQAVPVPAADAAFTGPGFFLPAASGGGNG